MTRIHTRLALLALTLAAVMSAGPLSAQDKLPWEQRGYGAEPPPTGSDGARPYAANEPRPADPYSPNTKPESTAPAPVYRSAPSKRPDDAYRPAPRQYDNRSAGYDRGNYEPPRRGAPYRDDERRTYSENEILNAGHSFFGSVSKGLAQAVAQLFKSSGRPNGYILGEDAGGAFIAGLRYGEGRLYTKWGDSRRVFWQGPTLGYDFGGEGSRTMVLVYNLRDTRDIFHRFGGVQGSAYVVGGVGVQILKYNHITLAPIRSGVGLRLGANVGYLKYTRRPTWNPF